MKNIDNNIFVDMPSTDEINQMVFKKIGLEKGDVFILKHHRNENQNEYKEITFTFDGKNISSVEAENLQKFLIAIAIGRYEIVKVQ